MYNSNFEFFNCWPIKHMKLVPEGVQKKKYFQGGRPSSTDFGTIWELHLDWFSNDFQMPTGIWQTTCPAPQHPERSNSWISSESVYGLERAMWQTPICILKPSTFWTPQPKPCFSDGFSNDLGLNLNQLTFTRLNLLVLSTQPTGSLSLSFTNYFKNHWKPNHTSKILQNCLDRGLNRGPSGERLRIGNRSNMCTRRVARSKMCPPLTFGLKASIPGNRAQIFSREFNDNGYSYGQNIIIDFTTKWNPPKCADRWFFFKFFSNWPTRCDPHF